MPRGTIQSDSVIRSVVAGMTVDYELYQMARGLYFAEQDRQNHIVNAEGALGAVASGIENKSRTPGRVRAAFLRAMTTISDSERVSDVVRRISRELGIASEDDLTDLFSNRDFWTSLVHLSNFNRQTVRQVAPLLAGNSSGQRYQLAIPLNSTFVLAPALTAIAVGIFALFGIALSWPLAIGLYIAFKAILLMSVIAHEAAHLWSDGQFSGKTFSQRISRAFQSLHQQNLFTAFLIGSDITNAFVEASDRQAQLEQLKRLLQDKTFAQDIAAWQDGAYYRGQGQTPPPFISAEEETKQVTKSAKEEKIAMNVAGFYALESGIGLISERSGQTPFEILQSILDGTISREDMLLIARFANATWKAGQPFRSLDRVTRDTFRPAALLTPEELEKDFIQIRAAAEKLSQKMKEEGTSATTPRDAQLDLLKKLLQSKEFALEMAAWLDGAYYRGQGQTPPAFISPEEETRQTQKSAKEEKIAINLAGFYALECGIGIISERTGKSPLEILRSILDGTISQEDMLLIARFANATWKAGQPFRSLDRIARDTFRPAALLTTEELEKDFVQIRAAAEKLYDQLMGSPVVREEMKKTSRVAIMGPLANVGLLLLGAGLGLIGLGLASLGFNDTSFYSYFLSLVFLIANVALLGLNAVFGTDLQTWRSGITVRGIYGMVAHVVGAVINGNNPAEQLKALTQQIKDEPLKAELKQERLELAENWVRQRIGKKNPEIAEIFVLYVKHEERTDIQTIILEGGEKAEILLQELEKVAAIYSGSLTEILKRGAANGQLEDKEGAVLALEEIMAKQDESSGRPTSSFYDKSTVNPNPWGANNPDDQMKEIREKEVTDTDSSYKWRRPVGPDAAEKEKQIVQDRINEAKSLEPKVEEFIRQVIERAGLTPDQVFSQSQRTKGLGSTLKKMANLRAENLPDDKREDWQKKLTIADIFDLLGGRIVVRDLESMEKLMEVIDSMCGRWWEGATPTQGPPQFIIVRKENKFLRHPKGDPYRAVQYTITIPGTNHTFELQLKTVPCLVASDLYHNAVYKAHILGLPVSLRQTVERYNWQSDYNEEAEYLSKKGVTAQGVKAKKVEQLTLDEQIENAIATHDYNAFYDLVLSRIDRETYTNPEKNRRVGNLIQRFFGEELENLSQLRPEHQQRLSDAGNDGYFEGGVKRQLANNGASLGWQLTDEAVDILKKNVPGGYRLYRNRFYRFNGKVDTSKIKAADLGLDELARMGLLEAFFKACGKDVNAPEVRRVMKDIVDGKNPVVMNLNHMTQAQKRVIGEDQSFFANEDGQVDEQSQRAQSLWSTKKLSLGGAASSVIATEIGGFDESGRLARDLSQIAVPGTDKTLRDKLIYDLFIFGLQPTSDNRTIPYEDFLKRADKALDRDIDRAMDRMYLREIALIHLEDIRQALVAERAKSEPDAIAIARLQRARAVMLRKYVSSLIADPQIAEGLANYLDNKYQDDISTLLRGNGAAAGRIEEVLNQAAAQKDITALRAAWHMETMNERQKAVVGILNPVFDLVDLTPQDIQRLGEIVRSEIPRASIDRRVEAYEKRVGQQPDNFRFNKQDHGVQELSTPEEVYALHGNGEGQYNVIYGGVSFSGQLVEEVKKVEVKEKIKAELRELLSNPNNRVLAVSGATDLGGIEIFYDAVDEVILENPLYRERLASMGIVAAIALPFSVESRNAAATCEFRRTDYLYIEEQAVPWQGAKPGDWGSESPIFRKFVTHLVSFGGGQQAAEELKEIAESGKPVTVLLGTTNGAGELGEAELAFRAASGDTQPANDLKTKLEAEKAALDRSPDGTDKTNGLKANKKKLDAVTRALNFRIGGNPSLKTVPLESEARVAEGAVNADLLNRLEDVIRDATALAEKQGRPLTTQDIGDIREVGKLAMAAHKNQRRKDGKTPYFYHPLKVTSILVNDFGVFDAIALQMALLHDAREDQSESYDQIKERLERQLSQAGMDLRRVNLIRLGVRMLTKLSQEEGGETEYFRRLVNPRSTYNKDTTSPGSARYSAYDDAFIRIVQLIKVADRMANLSDLGDNYRAGVELSPRASSLAERTLKKTLDTFIPLFLVNPQSQLTDNDRRVFYTHFLATLDTYIANESKEAAPLRDASVKVRTEVASRAQGQGATSESANQGAIGARTVAKTIDVSDYGKRQQFKSDFDQLLREQQSISVDGDSLGISGWIPSDRGTYRVVFTLDQTRGIVTVKVETPSLPVKNNPLEAFNKSFDMTPSDAREFAVWFINAVEAKLNYAPESYGVTITRELNQSLREKVGAFTPHQESGQGTVTMTTPATLAAWSWLNHILVRLLIAWWYEAPQTLNRDRFSEAHFAPGGLADTPFNRSAVRFGVNFIFFSMIIVAALAPLILASALSINTDLSFTQIVFVTVLTAPLTILGGGVVGNLGTHLLVNVISLTMRWAIGKFFLLSFVIRNGRLSTSESALLRAAIASRTKNALEQRLNDIIPVVNVGVGGRPVSRDGLISIQRQQFLESRSSNDLAILSLLMERQSDETYVPESQLPSPTPETGRSNLRLHFLDPSLPTVDLASISRGLGKNDTAIVYVGANASVQNSDSRILLVTYGSEALSVENLKKMLADRSVPFEQFSRMQIRVNKNAVSIQGAVDYVQALEALKATMPQDMYLLIPTPSGMSFAVPVVAKDLLRIVEFEGLVRHMIQVQA